MGCKYEYVKRIGKKVSTGRGETTIYFMDCEGFGAVEKSLNFDVKIFTLAVLLGSYLIYNSFNSLDETAIQQLSYLFYSLFLYQLIVHFPICLQW